MKTTELYIEQVLIGFLVVAIAALPWVHELTPMLGSVDLVKAIVEGSVLLGLAFWLGIPFDRFADTLSERLDKQHRLQFALNSSVDRKLFDPTVNTRKLDHDFYPEDKLRLKGWRDKEAVVNWIEYHRSRIRLTRALAVYGPALTFSATLGVGRVEEARALPSHQPSPVDWLWLTLVIAAYVVWAPVASPPYFVREMMKTKDTRGAARGTVARGLCFLFGMELPRTDKDEFIKYAEEWKRVSETGHIITRWHGDLRVWSDEWRMLAMPVLLLLAGLWLGFKNGKNGTAPLWIALTGAVLTVVTAWSWWRISSTFRSYLQDLDTTTSDGSICPLLD